MVYFYALTVASQMKFTAFLYYILKVGHGHGV
jgi:hypothetical protein